jgi:hypothetical protein
MRHVAVRIVALTLLLIAGAGLSTRAYAEPLVIDQNAWLNYAVIVNTAHKDSNLRINQRGDTNGISSVQLSGERDAWIYTHQRGRRNTGVIHQWGWITVSRVVQEGPHGPGGYTNLPTRFAGQQTDEGYLSYFMTGGFSLVTLTDQNHTWMSRFGRGR